MTPQERPEPRRTRREGNVIRMSHQLSASDRNPAPAFATASRTFRRSLVLRASRYTRCAQGRLLCVQRLPVRTHATVADDHCCAPFRTGLLHRDFAARSMSFCSCASLKFRTTPLASAAASSSAACSRKWASASLLISERVSEWGRVPSARSWRKPGASVLAGSPRSPRTSVRKLWPVAQRAKPARRLRGATLSATAQSVGLRRRSYKRVGGWSVTDTRQL
jgi:hypothetical protein